MIIYALKIYITRMHSLVRYHQVPNEFLHHLVFFYINSDFLHHILFPTSTLIPAPTLIFYINSDFLHQL